MSVPRAAGTRPAPTATPEPLLEPPGDVVGGVPGVVRRAVIVVDTRRAERKLHRMGLAQQHHTGLVETAHHGGVGIGNGVFQQRRSGGGGQTLHVDDVLGGVRDPVQRSGVPPGPQRQLGGLGAGHGAFARNQPESVQAVIKRLDAVEKMFHQLDGRQLTAVNLFR